MKEFPRKIANCLTQWTTNKRIWFKIGQVSLKIYIKLVVLQLAGVLLEGFINDWFDPPLEKSNADPLWVFMSINSFLYYFENAFGGTEHVSLCTGVLLNRRLVAFGPKSRHLSRCFLALNLIFLLIHSFGSILCYFLSPFSTSALFGIIIINVSLILLQIVIRFSFSKFYCLSSPEDFDEAMEKYQSRTEEHVQTTSRVNRWIWFGIGRLHLFIFYAMALILYAYFNVSVVTAALTDLDYEMPPEEKGWSLILLSFLSVILEATPDLSCSANLAILYRKQFVAFGPNSHYMAVFFLLLFVAFGPNSHYMAVFFFLLNTLFISFSFITAIRYYFLNKIPLHYMILLCTVTLIAFELQMMIRFSFSKFYNLTSKNELDAATKDMERLKKENMERNKDLAINNLII